MRTGKIRTLLFILLTAVTLAVISVPAIPGYVNMQVDAATDYAGLVINKFSRLARSTVMLRTVVASPTQEMDDYITTYSGVIVKREGPVAVIATVRHGCTPGGMTPSLIEIVGGGEDLKPTKALRMRIDTRPTHAADFCLVWAEIPGPAMPVAKNYSPGFGDRLHSVGSPGGIDRLPVEGLMAGYDPFTDTYVVSIPVSPGASGGPVVHEGKVIGLVSKYFVDVNHGTRVVTAENLLEFMEHD